MQRVQIHKKVATFHQQIITDEKGEGVGTRGKTGERIMYGSVKLAKNLYLFNFSFLSSTISYSTFFAPPPTSYYGVQAHIGLSKLVLSLSDISCYGIAIQSLYPAAGELFINHHSYHDQVDGDWLAAPKKVKCINIMTMFLHGRQNEFDKMLPEMKLFPKIKRIERVLKE